MLRTTKLKWTLRGYVVRLHPERWAHVATMWGPNMEKKEGRPRHRWVDILIAREGKQWSRQANDRKKSKELEKE